MTRKFRSLIALLSAAPTLAQTPAAPTAATPPATSTTAGVVNVTVPPQLMALAGCAMNFSSAGTVPVISVSNCPATTAPPPTPMLPPPTPVPQTFVIGANVVTKQNANVWAAITSDN